MFLDCGRENLCGHFVDLVSSPWAYSSTLDRKSSQSHREVGCDIPRKFCLTSWILQMGFGWARLLTTSTKLTFWVPKASPLHCFTMLWSVTFNNGNVCALVSVRFSPLCVKTLCFSSCLEKYSLRNIPLILLLWLFQHTEGTRRHDPLHPPLCSGKTGYSCTGNRRHHKL